MSAPHFDSTAYCVLHFQLWVDEAGRPTQKRQVVGRHGRIDTAFVAARVAAVQCVHRLRRAKSAAVAPTRETGGGEGGKPSAEATPVRWVLHDTEWGYEVRRDGLVVHRFWVHDPAAHELTV